MRIGQTDSKIPKENQNEFGDWRGAGLYVSEREKKRMLSLRLRVQFEMVKYRISQRTAGSTVQNNVNDVSGLFLGNHRDSP